MARARSWALVAGALVAGFVPFAAAGSAAPANRRTAHDAQVRLAGTAVPAPLAVACTRRERRTSRGCRPVVTPSDAALPEVITLSERAAIEFKLPAGARRLRVTVGRFGSDFATAQGLSTTVASSGRQLWRATLPAHLLPGTNRILIVAITDAGTEKYYFARARSE